MNFNAPLLKPIRILLFPFSLVYALIVWLRNFLYNKKVFPSVTFNLPVICVGNLSAGGTGKSTMVEFLIEKMQPTHKLAVLSRGYKRKTRGYALAGERTTALEIGDEPMQFHLKYPGIAVAVGEERVVAIPQLLHDRPDTSVIILDDAFQHRSIEAGMNVLLTEYGNLFTRDWYLPTGDLRDTPESYKRANSIVVTKCPPSLSKEEMETIQHEINPQQGQHLYFTAIRYGELYHITNRHPLHLNQKMEVLLVSGIANPRPLKKYLQDSTRAYYEILYGDHHIFTIDDWKEIRKRFDAISTSDKIILTTEKDAVRLIKFEQELRHLPVFVLPVTLEFIDGKENQFTASIKRFAESYRTKIIH